jgi:hypothetical protein
VARRLPTGHVVRSLGGATPTVVVVFDRGGDVAASVADVALVEGELTPALVRQAAAPMLHAGAAALLLDGNLSAEAIQARRQIFMVFWFGLG